LLVDLGSGQTLWAKQPDLSFVPASVTKVMTAYVAFEQIAAGKLDPQRNFIVPAEIARVWKGKGTSLFLSSGDKVEAETLLRGITTVSANDAAVVLAQGYAGSVPAWSGLMNAEARRLGMTHSHFNTPNGWPDEGQTYVSANDLVRLSRALIYRHPQRYRSYFGKRTLTWNGRTQQNHDPTSGIVPGADGIKTGFTREAGYNFLGSAERGGTRLVMVIAGSKSEAERAAAARAFFEWGFTAWKSRPLFGRGAVVARAQVQGGSARRVPLVAPGPVHASVPRDGTGRISLHVRYDGPLVAPIKKGAEVARLEIRVDDLPAGNLPLYAAGAVRKANFFDRLVNGVTGLFS